MRPAASLLQLALCLSTAAPLVSAWPGWLPEVDALIVRAENDDSSSPTPSPTAPKNTQTPTGTPSATPSNTGANGGNRNTAKPKPSQTGSQTGTQTGDDDSGATEFPPDAPAGSVVIQTPATTAAGTALYRIGEYITWGWNYTNLLGTPTAVDVLVSCSTATATWTLTSNMTFQTAASYVWNTSVQANSINEGLLTAMYTLLIKDSDASITDRAQPGYLGVFSGLNFGLYTGQPYTAFPDWRCYACSGALSNFDHHAIGFAVTMCLVTVLSFTWFVSGLGLN